MNLSPESSYNSSQLHRVLMGREARSTSLSQSPESHSAHPSSTQHFPRHPPSPPPSQNLGVTLPFFRTELINKTSRDELNPPIKSTWKLAFPSTHVINHFQGQNSELDSTQALKSPKSAFNSKEHHPDKFLHHNLIDSSVPRKLVYTTDQNDTPQFTDPFVNEHSILSRPTSASGESQHSIARRPPSSKSLTSAVSIPQTFVRKFSAGFLRHQSSKDRALASEAIDGSAMSLGPKPASPHRMRLNFVSNITRNGEQGASLEDLKCVKPPSRFATNTQPKRSSSLELGTDVSPAENQSDRHDNSRRLNGFDSRLQSKLPLGTDKRIGEVAHEVLPRSKRWTFSEAVRAPKTLAKNLSKNFPTTSRQDITESILEADRLDEVAKTATVFSVEPEIRLIDFNSKTGLSAQPANQGRKISAPPPLKILPAAATVLGPSSGSSTPATPFHKPTLFSQRYDSFSSLASSSVANVSLAFPCGGVRAAPEPLEAACTPGKLGESPSFPFRRQISTSQSTPSRMSPQSPVVESPTSLSCKFQFPYRKIEEIIAEYSEKSGPGLQYRSDFIRSRPSLTSLRMAPQLAMHAPDLIRPSHSTLPTRKANRGPGAEMYATLSALQELCREAQSYSDEDESLSDTERTLESF